MRSPLLVCLFCALLVGLGCDAVEEPVQVEVEDLRPGEGEAVQAGDSLVVHYVGALRTGKVFLSTCGEGAVPFGFRLGDAALIEGWNRGILGRDADEAMREAGVRRIVVPPALAWGARGAGCDADGLNCDVPPNETVVFYIQLLDVAEDDAPPASPPCAEELQVLVDSDASFQRPDTPVEGADFFVHGRPLL